jgi:uncharacterized protein (TIGR02145 family)
LVGLTVAQVKAGTIDNGKYRLPTNAENAAYGSPTYVAGNGWATGTTPTAGIHTGNIGTSFLPAAGRRDHDTGATSEVGLHGHYWSSRAYNSTAGSLLIFSSGSVSTPTATDAAHGLSVRCVPQ